MATIPEPIINPVADLLLDQRPKSSPPVTKKRTAAHRVIISICTQGKKLYYSWMRNTRHVFKVRSGEPLKITHKR